MKAAGRRMVNGTPEDSTANSMRRSGFCGGALSTPYEESNTTRRTPAAAAPSSSARMESAWSARGMLPATRNIALTPLRAASLF